MKIYSSSSHRKAPGIALVSVVALVTLLAFLVIALLLRLSFYREVVGSEKGASQARQLADYGAALVVSDLQAELALTAAGVVETADQGRYYDVNSPLGYGIVRSLVDEGLANDDRYLSLVKQSTSRQPFATGQQGEIASIASNVSTASASRAGRAISPERWLAPRFLPRDATLDETQVPDWIYLSRSGGHPTEFEGDSQADRQTSSRDNPDYVVGRLAYQVYDTSGLLDANVAGFGKGAPEEEIQRKGSLLWADLSSLPGGGTDLAEWRNHIDWDQSYQSMIVDRGQERGWLEVPDDAQGQNNVFLSRSDLLAFQERFPNYLSEDSLPYFTHFSRETNAPSWGPSRNASEMGGRDTAGFGYRDNRNATTAQNRFLPGVRVTTPFTRRLSPIPIENEVAVRAEVGEPLMTTRFPLRAIELFQLGEQQARIQEFFGLSGTAALWTYTELTSSNEIKTLEEVAQEGREPNFFEVLNAGLLAGSLGQTNGVWAAGPFFDNHDLDRVTARQVLRIGACIIDQYDVDNDPTVIAPVATDPFGTAGLVEIAGVENLPYLDIIGQLHLRLSDDIWPEIAAYYQLQLWNPHQNSAEAPPGNFRIISEGESYVNLRWWPNGWPGGPSFEEEGDPFLADESTSFLEFSTPLSGSTSDVADRPHFEKPVQLMGDLLSAHSPESVLPGRSNDQAFAGIYLGKALTGSDRNARRRHRNGFNQATGHIKFDRPVSIKLQKLVTVGGSSTWVTYQTIPRIEHHHGNVPWQGSVEDLARRGRPQLRISYGRSDPRSIRFGMGSAGSGISSRVVQQTIWPNPNANLAWSSRWEPGGSFRGAPGAFAGLSQNPDGPMSYTGRDGVPRESDGRADLGYTEGSPFALGAGRPIVLNRPFRSVAEMGYAFRDEPWMTLNFHSENSADHGLLDLFSLTQTPLRAGTVNLNRAPTEVIEALINDTLKNTVSGEAFGQTGPLAKSIREALNASPVATAADLGVLLDSLSDEAGKQAYEKEALLSALADVHNGRTWNVTIDVIAQSGRLFSTADDLSDFRVEGEQRLWVHLALDRISGKLIDQQIEVVY